MTRWHIDDPQNLSARAMRDPEGTKERYPSTLEHRNPDILRMTLRGPGIIEVESRHGDDDLFVITGGIHGDEKAGIVILDRLVHNILNGSIPVRRNLLLMYGNLAAMAANDGRGVRCIEPEVGVTANLNRCFNRGLFNEARCYAERRANNLMHAAHIASGCRVEAIDIHQSFAVPVLSTVRPTGDRTEYTYAMLYPHTNVDETLKWIFEHYSDIVAGAVLNDMRVTHTTWAGYMAAEYHAHAATFEQGTIGHLDHVTFTPQLYENLARAVGGNTLLAEPEGFDVWQCIKPIVRNSDEFSFLDENGAPVTNAPLDFVPLRCSIVARDGETLYALEPGQRLLFANAAVPLGDRAAQIIAPFETSVVPRP
ncbi:MAG: Succinylglutamate desuccinylase [Parcubacteria bacterium C7867-001]|nr:MAG: Succinylglutamate desuccinylase [Parcubacteria bacterium C7867-001]